MQQSLVFDAMHFALQAHAGQKRRYTGDHYFTHLAEVAGIVATVDSTPETLAVAYLHDTIEDSATTFEDLQERFGFRVAAGVLSLSDQEIGNRATRKAAACQRLKACPPHIQSIKVADIISNTSSIALHDRKFARVYIPECMALLSVLVTADRKLHYLALKQLQEIELAGVA